MLLLTKKTQILKTARFAVYAIPLLVIGGILAISSREASASAASNMVFPIIGNATYSNDYEQPRFNGKHHATDIFAPKGTPVVSVTDGVITYVPHPQPSWGYMVKIVSDSGWQYNYLHLNNDNPGTDDGRGGAMQAYAPAMIRGDRVRKGQLIGWVGDSGNAEGTPPHLHFERYKPDDTPTNPYYALRVIKKLRRPAPALRQSNEIIPDWRREDGANVALGNFAGDETREVVTGVGPGYVPKVSVYNQNNKRMYAFMAYYRGFKGGVDVAAGDLDGDGFDEVITGPGEGGGPRVRVYKADGTLVRDIIAFEAEFRGGVRVASADTDGDGVDEIIVGRGPGAEPEVKIFKGDGTELGSFIAGRSGYRGGVDVAAANVSGSAAAEIITGYSKSGGPYIKIFDASGQELRTIRPFSTSYLGGIRVSAGESVNQGDGYAEIAVVPQTEYVPLMKLYRGDGTRLSSTYFLPEWWRGYYDVAISHGVEKTAAGVNRRTSIRDVPGLWNR